MPRTSRIVLSVLAAALVSAAAGCGSGSDTATEASSTPGATTPAASFLPTAPPTVAVPTPSVVAAAALPAVTGPQGKRPTVAKGSAPAPTALLAHDLIVGTGATATPGAEVTVNYTLALYSTGALVQSSYDSGQPYTFPLAEGQTVPGFDGGVVGMKVGGRRELVIPPALGYRDQAQQGIPANSTLTFVVDLVSVG